MSNKTPAEVLAREYSDDDLNVIIQDWDHTDTDQAVSMALAADLLRERTSRREKERSPADAVCVKLQEAANTWRSTADGIAALCAEANEEIDELKTERDEAWRAYHDCQEVAIRLTCEADTAALQRDALAEKVKELQDKLDHCYDLLKNNDTDIWN